MSEQHTQESCRQRWEAIRNQQGLSIAEIDGIDRDTPWSEREPAWWLHMMSVRRELAKAQ